MEYWTARQIVGTPARIRPHPKSINSTPSINRKVRADGNGCLRSSVRNRDEIKVVVVRMKVFSRGKVRVY